MASVTINVLDPEFYVDPWQAYRWLRDVAPVNIAFGVETTLKRA